MSADDRGQTLSDAVQESPLADFLLDIADAAEALISSVGAAGDRMADKIQAEGWAPHLRLEELVELVRRGRLSDDPWYTDLDVVADFLADRRRALDNDERGGN